VLHHDSDATEDEIGMGNSSSEESVVVSDDESEYDISNPSNDDDLDVGQFVIVKFEMSHSARYYVGKVLNCGDEAVESSYEISCLRRNRKCLGEFVFPQVEDICHVNRGQIVTKLGDPKLGRRGGFIFGDDIKKLKLNLE
jgi:hypothetical protein